MDLFSALCFIIIVLAWLIEKVQHHIHGREWAQERAELLNRIQAPELAVLPEGEPVPYAAPDDDDAYWEGVKEREG